MSELEKTEDGQLRIARLNSRTDHMISRELEKSDQARTMEAQGEKHDDEAPPKHQNGTPEIEKSVRFEESNAADPEEWQELLQDHPPELRARVLELLREERRQPGFLKKLRDDETSTAATAVPPKSQTPPVAPKTTRKVTKPKATPSNPSTDIRTFMPKLVQRAPADPPEPTAILPDRDIREFMTEPAGSSDSDIVYNQGCHNLRIDIGIMDVDVKTELEDENNFLNAFLVTDRDEAVRTHIDIIDTINLMSGDIRKYQRERRSQTRAIVSEIYSAPRVTAMARRRKKYGIEPGVALDLTTSDDQGRPWDFSDPRARQRAKELFEQERPLLLIGSPMCTAFSRLQAINRAKAAQVGDGDKYDEQRAKALVHLRFVCDLYLQQVTRGHYFLHEHPNLADSWGEECVMEVLAKKGVSRVIADQCMYGQQTTDGRPIQKGTGFMGNNPEVMKMLTKRCRG